MTDVSFREFALFCKTPKTRQEIKEGFNLTTIESWHCVKRFAKYRSDIMVTICRNKPGNPRVFTTRKCCLEELERNK